MTYCEPVFPLFYSWGFVKHAGIDGKSRLKMYKDNTALTVLTYFVRFVQLAQLQTNSEDLEQAVKLFFFSPSPYFRLYLPSVTLATHPHRIKKAWPPTSLSGDC